MAARKAQGVTLLEAEGFQYQRAFDFVATMATKANLWSARRHAEKRAELVRILQTPNLMHRNNQGDTVTISGLEKRYLKSARPRHPIIM
ncbi:MULTISPECIES: hypothetical protein [Rhizobium]|uniref:hypothetical protein n=1 Tax=Rhizobium TaxID=379 RepID=UPI00102FE652|nr:MULTISPECIES: hypothetical protein [Rhizobium]MBY5407435.1 hypothetical protein [Rhizobium leguminosarum]TBD81057.1 hypothetical protein ELH11_14730 [Rhizobium ruizarguesonis]TBE12218.1 hypothetical protein ELH09_14810 [Rhizobium ruizarguesonis]WSH32179.1 hypothetical protein U8P70_16655 [Rhizobium ruizarguesonis]